MRIVSIALASLMALSAAPLAACAFHGGGPGRFSAFGGLGNMPSPDFDDPWSSTPTTTTQVTTTMRQEPQPSAVPNAPVDNATLVKLGAKPTQNEKAKPATTGETAPIVPKKT